MPGNTTTMTRSSLVGTSTQLLPQEISSEIWGRAVHQAVIPQLVPSKPMVLGDNLTPTITRHAQATIVGEGEQKKASQLELGSIKIVPIKAQVGAEFTLESILANPAGVLGVLSEELSSALARQIDSAVIHGLVCDTGAAISTTSTALSAVTNAVTLSSDADDTLTELETAYALTAEAGYDWTGALVAPQFVSRLRTAKNSINGTRLFPDVGFGRSIDNIMGLPAKTTKIVSGKYDSVSAKNTRLIAGDFSALKFGYAAQIPVKRIEYGDPFGNGDLQARNCVAYLAEVIFGWGIMSENCFVTLNVGE